MIAPDASRHRRDGTNGASGRPPDLPFRIELWEEHRANAQCVVTRIHSTTLAEAVFRAACEQYPGRHLSLWRGEEQLAEHG
jgi:hypothetical protein